MAEIKPLKVAGTGNGNGELREFEAGDTLPEALVPGLSDLSGRVSTIEDDAAQLATDVGSLSGRVSTVEGEKPLGWGQTWQNVAASRAVGVAYTNTTGRPIMVSVSAYTPAEAGNRAIFRINGAQIANTTSGQLSAGTSFQVVVPTGSAYEFGNTSGGYIISWVELR